MNIEKLAKHLKIFTIDEINMISEFDCEKELQQLLTKGKIILEQNIYKYQEENNTYDFVVCPIEIINLKVLDFETAIKYFLDNYVKNNCKQATFRRYNSILKYNIYPFFKNKNLNDITCSDVLNFYYFCKNRNFPPKVLKNTLTLLNQIIKYFQNQGTIDNSCNFQVRRLSDKTNFSVDRINFKCKM